jgi:hypothetical protein
VVVRGAIEQIKMSVYRNTQGKFTHIFRKGKEKDREIWCIAQFFTKFEILSNQKYMCIEMHATKLKTKKRRAERT